MGLIPSLVQWVKAPSIAAAAALVTGAAQIWSLAWGLPYAVGVPIKKKKKKFKVGPSLLILQI